MFYFPKYSTSTEYIIGEYYIILIFATECRFGHALYNHLQERVKLLFSSENYLDSRSPTTNYCIIVLEKRNLSQKLRKVLNNPRGCKFLPLRIVSMRIRMKADHFVERKSQNRAPPSPPIYSPDFPPQITQRENNIVFIYNYVT